ncbi:MAG: PilZ domain-containing protein [Desulfobacteraceae bacterium]|nr:PilZ domain-containing protein [Desulfobacteraceae bacterium]
MMSNFVFPRKEKRKAERKQLYFYLKVNRQRTGSLLGYLADISSEGVMVLTSDAIELNKVFALTIDLREEFSMDCSLDFEAKSLWCEQDVNPDYMVAGFQFESLDKMALERMNYLISEYSFKI